MEEIDFRPIENTKRRKTRYHAWCRKQLAELEARAKANPLTAIEKRKIELSKAILLRQRKELEEFLQDQKPNESYFARIAAIHEHEAEEEIKRLDLLLSNPSNKELWEQIDAWEKKRLSLHSDDRGSPKDIEFLDPNFKWRERGNLEAFRFQFGYQLPWRENIETLKRISRGKRILEICAGLALWAKLLSDAGVDIICTDNFDWSDYSATFYPVERLDWVEAVRKYPSDVLLMIWPPGGKSKTLLDAVKAFRGTDIVLIGELGGLTGGEDLVKYLDNEWQSDRGQAPDRYHVHQPKNFSCLGLFHWQQRPPKNIFHDD